MPAVALYARVSTTEQNVDAQLDALTAYALARGFEVVDTYIDHGISGAKAQRPALDRMMADAKRRRFDCLAVVKLDRLARSVRHLTELGATLEALGVDLMVLDQGIDTSTPAGRLLFNVLASIAEFERDLIIERTRAGIDAARKRGRVFGRPRGIPAEHAPRLRRMVESGKSLAHIAGVLGVHKSTVGREGIGGSGCVLAQGPSMGIA